MSQIHILDGQTDQILDVITKQHIIEDVHKQSLKDTLETFDFTTFANKRFSQYLEKRNKIIIPGEDGEYREFIMHEVIKNINRQAEVFANASYLELKKQAIIYPQTFDEQTASQMVGHATNGTEWRPGIIEIDNYRTFNVENHRKPYAFLKTIANEFDAELRFRVETDGNRITGRFVDLLERRGRWQGREVTFGKDLESIKRTEKTDNVYTALVGIGPEREDGTRLEVLVEDQDALQRWGRRDEQSNLQHLIDTYEPQSTRQDMTEDELRQYTRTELNKRINEVVEFEADIIDLEHVPGLENKKIRFGDTIKIKDTNFNPPLYLEARIFEQERSIVDKSAKKVKLGDFTEFTEEEVQNVWEELRQQINQKITEAEVREYTYDKMTINDKDTTVFEEGKTFAELQAGDAQTAAEQHADSVASDAQNAAESHADTVASNAENNAEEYADTVSGQALIDAQNYAVAKEVYDNKMTEIANDLNDKAGIEYVDGELRKIEVGGRNLIENTSDELVEQEMGSYRYYITGDVTLEDIGLEDGDYVTLSFYAEVPENASSPVQPRISSYDEDGNHSENVGGKKIYPGEKGYTSYAFKLPEGTREVRFAIHRVEDRTGAPFNFSYKEIKVEKGNKATDWTPAPEDTQNQLDDKADASITYTIEEVDNRLSNKVSVTEYTTDMDGVVQDLNTHSTLIGQNEDAIALKADSSRVDTLEGTVEDHSASLNVMSDEISSKVEADYVTGEIDKLQVGGRNFIRNSNVFIENDESHDSFQRNNAEDLINFLNENDEVTISVYVEVENANPSSRERIGYELGLRYDDGSISTINAFLNPAEGESFKGRLTYTYNDHNSKTITDIRHHNIYIQTDGDYLKVGQPKLEKGNKATDWTPAPEDTQSQIDDLDITVEQHSTDITQNANAITSKAEQSELDTLTGRVSTTESEIQQQADQIQARVTDSEARSIFTQEADSFTFDADQINFSGHVFGEDATFSGLVEGGRVITRDDNNNFRTFMGNGSIESSDFVGRSIVVVKEGEIRIGTLHDDDDYTYDTNLKIREDAIESLTGNLHLGSANNIYVGNVVRGNGDYDLRLGGADLNTDVIGDNLYLMTNNKVHITSVDDYGAYKPLVSDSLELPNASGTSGTLTVADRHMISEYNGGLVIYGDTYESEPFKVRLHDDRSNYRNSLWIDSLERFNVAGSILSEATADNTTSNSPNMHVFTGSGRFVRSTSAKKYKSEIEKVDVDPYKLLDLEPKSWYDKQEIADNGGLIEGLNQHYGIIADDLEAIGLSDYVVYHDNEIENYEERVWTLLIPITRDLKQYTEDEINWLKMENDLLKSRVKKLEEAS